MNYDIKNIVQKLHIYPKLGEYIWHFSTIIGRISARAAPLVSDKAIIKKKNNFFMKKSRGERDGVMKKKGKYSSPTN